MTPAAPTQSMVRRGLVVLTLINLFNYLDRLVVSALAESIKRSELALSDKQLGSLVTGFVIVYMLASPVFGALGDRRSRPKLLALGVALWSAATAASAFAWSFLSLFLARAVLGVGEAAYGTITPSLLADYFPKQRLGRVFSIFYAAVPIGSALGYVLGGLIDQHFGWRAAFFVVGVPGFVLAILSLRLPDPPRGAQEAEPTPPARGLRETYAGLVRNRTYVLSGLGYAAYTFAIGGLAFWMPAFLERARGLPRAEATIQFGAIVVVTGFVGTFSGGWIGDYFLKRTKQAHLWVCATSALAATPFAYVALTSTSRPVYFAALVVGQILLFASTGPISSAIASVVAPAERATAVALLFCVIHLLGDVPSPPLIGALSDGSSLAEALRIVPVALAVAGGLWLFAAWEAGRREARAGSPIVSTE